MFIIFNHPVNACMHIEITFLSDNTSNETQFYMFYIVTANHNLREVELFVSIKTFVFFF